MPSSSRKAAEAAKKRKASGAFQEPSALPKFRADKIARQEMRVSLCLTRVRSARSKLALDPESTVWQAALAARRDEYERAKLALSTLRG